MMYLRNKFVSCAPVASAGPGQRAPGRVAWALACLAAVGAGLQPIAHASDTRFATAAR